MNTIPKPEYPRPERQRARWLNLNGTWDFQLFPEGAEADEAAFAQTRAAYAQQITVPYSWVCPLSGVEQNVAGTGWYRRRASYARAERLFICFGAVDYRADVYINGAHAGAHQGGYSYFEIEITELWRAGENTIEVRAEDYRRETQLYGKQGYGDIQGIWQTVWLEERPQQYIKDWRVTTHIDGAVNISVQADAPDGSEVSACFAGRRWTAEVGQGRAELELHIESPQLWSPDSPYLYEGVLRLGADEVSTYFGIRELRAANYDGRSYKWILLNGKPIYLNGTLDQAFNPQGHFTYPSDAAMRDEAWRLKRLGLNMVRIHIKPEEPRKLYWMDLLGILVMEDIPCFWGEPVAEARAAYEAELPEMITRDINHPATFAWAVFNESWGLLSGDRHDRQYLPETQEWVRAMYRRAKQLDPSRIVEDNSPCRYDHVETDLNTWHFYLNGYETVRDHIRNVVDNTYPGSEFNFIAGNQQTDAPLMNSECGMVWGVEGSAGDSDLAWQYHYMLNEYRLHDKLCGFVFTEFHDVVNEFNGYYRIDDTDKDFGYQDMCRGMSLRDLHAADFLAVDCAPMRSVAPGAQIRVPLVISSFTDAHHAERCSVEWELWHDGLNGRVSDGRGALELPQFGWGATALGELSVDMPVENAVAVLSLYLKASDGAVISRNFVAFDVQAALPDNMVELPVDAGRVEGFAPVWTALAGEKLCLGGEGQVSYHVSLPGRCEPLRDMNIYLEVGAKRVLKKDMRDASAPQADLDFMRGYLVDRGAFDNSYWMTDESRCPSVVDVLIDGEQIDTLYLANDWADARGMISWHYQPDDRRLDEAGSYGEHRRVPVPSRLLPALERAGGFELTLRVRGQGGLAIYGRKCGRYAHGLVVELV